MKGVKNALHIVRIGDGLEEVDADEVADSSDYDDDSLDEDIAEQGSDD